ncbi:DNA phosphorothioation-dependent restriction protein DptF [Planomicrobium koreense]|uniref:DNA phosphorothioation-dependent restriction protein DptF n=1 Tax=Planococcus koreensis TaxID=112331 RepID=A0A7W8CRC6_9BACL|nr:DNA phosphorothioation-dependent restriction protein DptF [Planococcus koreensis]MBB5180255.1 DNA phosphorothioation-dependent restriction protein DptF [Planococcus koreensis]
MHSQNQNQFLFQFLSNALPNATQAALKMEQLIYTDSASAIVKARLFAEEVLKEVFKIEEIDTTYISSLYDKVLYISNNGLIVKEIQHSFDTIRRSGNKAAHDGTYDDITVAFQLHKDMYKIAVWFYETYTSEQEVVPTYTHPKPGVDPRLIEMENMMKTILEKSLLSPTGSSNETNKGINTEEEVPVEEGNIETRHTKKVEVEESLEEEIEEYVLPGIEETVIGVDEDSSLLKEISRLKDSAKEAIENANEFSGFKEYMHVDRKIQKDLESALQNQSQKNGASLILLCGSVGDGKSHLLAYMNKKYPEMMNEYFIHNDATESFSPEKDALETLEELLNPFSDENIDTANQKVILAINLGVLHNFINYEHQSASFNKLKKFVESSNLFSQNIVTNYELDQFNLFNFTDYHPYELTAEGPVSEFYQSILHKICKQETNNPFYMASKRDEQNNYRTMLHENYDFLKNEFVQKQVISLIIQTIVKKKLVISTRAFLNFVADILICENLVQIKKLTDFEKLKNALPTLLFDNADRSPILKSLSYFDPIHTRTSVTDQLIIELNTLSDWKTINDEYIKNETSRNWLKDFETNSELVPKLFSEYFEGFIRIIFLTNSNFSKVLQDEVYEAYMLSLFHFNTGDIKKIKAFYENFKNILYQWKGAIEKGYILMSHPLDKYKIGQKFTVKPVLYPFKQLNGSILYTFKSSIPVGYKKEDLSKEALLDIDYPLYSLLEKVSDGYRPNKGDEEDAIKFTEFLEKVLNFGDKNKELLVNFSHENKYYKIKRDDFGSIVFRRW